MARRLTTRATAAALCAPVLFLLLMNPYAPSAGTVSVPLGEEELMFHNGQGFWSDPCTWDGIVAGANGVLCATLNAAACAWVAVAFWKAAKLDNCF